MPIDTHAHYVPPQLIAAIRSKGGAIGVVWENAEADDSFALRVGVRGPGKKSEFATNIRDWSFEARTCTGPEPVRIVFATTPASRSTTLIHPPRFCSGSGAFEPRPSPMAYRRRTSRCWP